MLDFYIDPVYSRPNLDSQSPPEEFNYIFQSLAPKYISSSDRISDLQHFWS